MLCLILQQLYSWEQAHQLSQGVSQEETEVKEARPLSVNAGILLCSGGVWWKRKREEVTFNRVWATKFLPHFNLG